MFLFKTAGRLILTGVTEIAGGQAPDPRMRHGYGAWLWAVNGEPPKTWISADPWQP